MMESARELYVNHHLTIDTVAKWCILRSDAARDGRQPPGERPMSPYRDGFQSGVQDQQGDGTHAVDVAAAFAQADAHGEPVLTPEQEANYWLGYYHGRYYGRTGQLPQGLLNQIRDN
jgi:hypothetical protein